MALGKTLESPLAERRSNQSILKEINLEYSLERLMLKLQYFDLLMWRANSSGKGLDTGKDWRQEGKGMMEDEMVGWHHWLDVHESERLQGMVKDRETWQAAVHRVTISWTWLSDWTIAITKDIWLLFHMKIRFCFHELSMNWRCDIPAILDYPGFRSFCGALCWPIWIILFY